MVDRALPGLGLKGFWALGENGWNTDMDKNLLSLSVLTQLSVLSQTTALPGSPTDGMIYIVPHSAGSNPDTIAVHDNGAWVYLTPTAGMIAYAQDVPQYLKWTGTAWAVLTTGGGGSATFAGLTDVSVSSPGVGQVPTWNGTQWANEAPTSSSPPGASPTIVQSKAFTQDDSPFVLTSAPTAGNMLVAAISHWNASPAVVAGWTVLANKAGSNDTATVLYKVVPAGDTTSQSPMTSLGGADCTIWELSGVGGIPNICTLATDQTGTVATIPGAALAGSILLGQFGTTSDTSGFPTFLTGATAGPTASAASGGGSGYYRTASSFHTAFSTSGVVTLAATWSGSTTCSAIAVSIPGRPGASTTLAGLTDVSLTSLSTNQVLTWNGTHWTNEAPAGGASTFAGLSDVSFFGLATGDLALYNGATWSNLPFSSLLDAELGGAQGDIIYRGASDWVALSPGSAGQVLTAHGASANPTWATPSGGSSTLASDTDVTITTPSNEDLLAYDTGSTKWKNANLSAILDGVLGSTQGSVLYRGSTGWAALGPGTAGQSLTTQGAGANPSWAAPSGGGGVSILSPPLISALGAVSHNPNSDTFTQRTSGAIPCLVMKPSGGDGNSEIFCELMANPQGSGQFSLVTKISLDPGDSSGGYHGGGLVIYNSATGASYAYWTSCNGGASYSTFFATVASLGAGPSASASGNYQGDCFHHIDYDGTDIKFGLSKNGVDVYWSYSVAISAFIGAVTHVGIGWGNYNSSSVLQWQHFFCGARGSSGIIVT